MFYKGREQKKGSYNATHLGLSIFVLLGGLFAAKTAWAGLVVHKIGLKEPLLWGKLAEEQVVLLAQFLAPVLAAPFRASWYLANQAGQNLPFMPSLQRPDGLVSGAEVSGMALGLVAVLVTTYVLLFCAEIAICRRDREGLQSGLRCLAAFAGVTAFLLLWPVEQTVSVAFYVRHLSGGTLPAPLPVVIGLLSVVLLAVAWGAWEAFLIKRGMTAQRGRSMKLLRFVSLWGGLHFAGALATGAMAPQTTLAMGLACVAMVWVATAVVCDKRVSRPTAAL